MNTANLIKRVSRIKNTNEYFTSYTVELSFPRSAWERPLVAGPPDAERPFCIPTRSVGTRMNEKTRKREKNSCASVRVKICVHSWLKKTTLEFFMLHGI